MSINKSRLLTVMVFVVSIVATASAQTFTERLQTPNPGWGTITITHSSDIDALVNANSIHEESVMLDTATVNNRFSGKTYKTNGYRVQVIAGGNARASKDKVTKAGSVLKRVFPDESVYVHFYSPRWICRMGNYRTYEEAYRMLRQVREMGYNQATIVKGKITLKY